LQAPVFGEMPTFTLDGATCVRSDGNIVLTIPEAAVIQAATVPNLPRGLRFKIGNRDAFLDGVTIQLLEMSYEDFAGYKETELRRFLRMIIRAVAFLDGDEAET
jgi:hypothetical protein